MKRDSKPIYQKILAKRYYKDIYGITLEDAILPGKSPQNCQEIEEAISCVQSTMHKQPYIEIFPENLISNSKNNTSELPEILRLYVNYLFYQIKKEYYRLPDETVIRIV